MADRLRDIQAIGQLAVDATREMTHVVESMHRTIARASLPWAPPVAGRTRGITGLVYASVRLVTHLVGHGIDTAATLLPDPAGDDEMAPERWRLDLRAALNGVVGDHLERTGNALALPMSFRCHGALVTSTTLMTEPVRPWLLVIHGLCMHDLQWTQAGYGHPEWLAGRLGFTPIYLRYNSGRPIAHNGRALAEQLESLTANLPAPPRIYVLAHSLGGLIARSAFCHAQSAGHGWLGCVRDVVFLGTPHLGAPLERLGNWVQTVGGATAYAAPLARIGRLRSAGITDLRHGRILESDDDRFSAIPAPHTPPLPRHLRCFAIAASKGKRRGDFLDRLLGDGMVPIASALAEPRGSAPGLSIPPHRQALFLQTDHWGLLRRRDIAEHIAQWLATDD